MTRPKTMAWWRWWLSRPFRYLSAFLYGPLWEGGSDWCDEVAIKIEGEW